MCASGDRGDVLLQDPAILEDEEEHKPIDLSWPDTTRKRIVYVLVAPIVFSLWITLPDCKSPRGQSRSLKVMGNQQGSAQVDGEHHDISRYERGSLKVRVDISTHIFYA